MTLSALDLGVRAFEWIVCDRMIKNLLVQQDDVGVPALVFRVTLLALGVLDVLAESVKAQPLADVSRDFVVAVQAEAALRGLAEPLVAAEALVFILGVPLDDRARHDKTFQVDSRCGFSHQQCHHSTQDQQYFVLFPHLDLVHKTSVHMHSDDMHHYRDHE